MPEITCPTCRESYPKDSEQAAAISLYDMCIVCCVKGEKEYDFVWSIEDVLVEKSRCLAGRRG